MIIEYTNHLESLGDLNDLLIERNAHIHNISALHGFFSALACSPVAMMLSRTHRAVWGGDAPVWNNMSEAMLFTDTSIAFMLSTENTLSDINEHYTPLLTDNNGSEVEPTIDDWIIGFVEGVSLSLQSWKILLDDKKINNLVLPILRIYNNINPETEWSLSKQDRKEDKARTCTELVKLLETNVPLIYQFFTPHRESTEGMSDFQIITSSPTMDDNIKCPCGSGMQFKECCFANTTNH
jgi:uncharacterized protein